MRSEVMSREELGGFLAMMVCDTRRCGVDVRLTNRDTGEPVDIDETLCLSMVASTLDKVIELICHGTTADPTTELADVIVNGISDYLCRGGEDA
jgi:phosphotransferase system HPr-like phosphotransfer protein